MSDILAIPQSRTTLDNPGQPLRSPSPEPPPSRTKNSHGDENAERGTQRSRLDGKMYRLCHTSADAAMRRTLHKKGHAQTVRRCTFARAFPNVELKVRIVYERNNKPVVSNPVAYNYVCSKAPPNAQLVVKIAVRENIFTTRPVFALGHSALPHPPKSKL